MEKKLEVHDLRISFRTVSGKVQAVRGVNFELYKGETLAIVGESGSGKSVTSKAILGILAGNAMIEGGKILYDGQDLLKITETDFHKIRGDRIAMIFQDPLSSLNPIMHIGRQLTEAMLLKGKARQKASRAHFNSAMAQLKRQMSAVCGKAHEAECMQLCKAFERVEFRAIELEKAYAEASEAARQAISDIENALFRIEKHAYIDARADLTEIAKTARAACNDYVVEGEQAGLVRAQADKLISQIRILEKSGEYGGAEATLHALLPVLRAAVQKPQPDFFALGYYAAFSHDHVPRLPVEKLNVQLRAELDAHFLNLFMEWTEKALAHAARLDSEEKRDFHAEAIALVEDLKRSASGAVQRVTKTMARHRALKLMEEVGISDPRRRFRQYPFEFSGGMRQRIVIAIALAADPDILICDEPTTALDVTIQAQILELINRLKAERRLSILFITHDLGVVANMADHIAVMYAGKIVEYGTAADIFYRPAHPYTWALLSSMPDLDTDDQLESIPGTPPNMIYPPVGDAFAARNKYALEIDFKQPPPMFRISDTHFAATWLLHPNAPKVPLPKVVTDRIARMNQRGGKSDG